MVERCEACGHRYERIDGYWVGAMIISFALTAGAFIVVFLAGVAIWWPDPPYTALLIVSIIVGALAPVVGFPWSRTIFAAMELATHELEPHERTAAARYIASRSEPGD
jgi:uncharacterized protein (DUF983 family)